MPMPMRPRAGHLVGITIVDMPTAVDLTQTYTAKRNYHLVTGTNGRIDQIQEITPQVDVAKRRNLVIAYDADARIKSLTWPDGRVESFSYDADGRLKDYIPGHFQPGSGTTQAGARLRTTYDSSGQVNGVGLGSGETNSARQSVVWSGNTATITTYEGDNAVASQLVEVDGRKRVVKLYVPDSSSKYTLFEYCDTAGGSACPNQLSDNQLRRITKPNGGKVEYAYDTAGRVKSTSETGN